MFVADEVIITIEEKKFPTRANL